MKAAFSLSQQQALAISPKVMAFLSILGSGYIVYASMKDPKHRKMVFYRIMIGMSCSDILASANMFLTTWPMPSGTAYVYGAVGNQHTCTTQGFFFQLGVMTPMYNGFLALYYFFVIGLEWTDQKFKKVETFGHIFIVAFALSTGIAGLALTLYNSADVWCWIAPYPEGCSESFLNPSLNEQTTSCTRGDNATIYRYVFYYGIIWINILWAFISMIQVYWSVRKQENKMKAYVAQYTEADNSEHRRVHAKSRQVAHQSALYVGSFVATWLGPSITRSVQGVGREANYYRLVTLAVLIPCQGIFNFLVFIRPRVRRHFQKKKADKEAAALRMQEET